MLKNVVAENEGKIKVVKVEVDSNQDLVATYGVRIPFCATYKHKQVQESAVLFLGLVVDKHTEAMQVYGLPTLVLFNGGEAVEGSKREGALAQKGVMKWLESNGVTL